MNTQIVFTPHQLILVILAVCGAIITVSSAIGVIMGAVRKFKKPEEDQNERIHIIEEHLEKIDRCLNIDKQRLDRIEYGSTVTQEALLALLDHAINSDDISPVKEAKKKLERYLLDKEKPMNYEEL